MFTHESEWSDLEEEWEDESNSSLQNRSEQEFGNSTSPDDYQSTRGNQQQDNEQPDDESPSLEFDTVGQ